MSREQQFFRMCTTLPFPEEPDERDESSIPELARVAELRAAGTAQQAIEYAKALAMMYPTNDLLPFTIARIYNEQHSPGEALEVAVNAIPACPRRYRLYSVAGLAELERGKLAEALVWWSRSVVAQCSVARFGEVAPFLHIAHAAELIGATGEARAVFVMVDTIEPARIRLGPPALEKLAPLKRHWSRQPFTNVVQHLTREYLGR